MNPSRTQAKTGTMRAATIESPRTSRAVGVSPPEPGPDEVLIRMQGSGVCASSLPVWSGREWFQYPQPAGAPGHEGWGIVDAVGANVTTLSTGQRVAALSYRAFAEYDIAAASAVVPLPPELDDMDVPGEALGCAMNIYRRAAIERGNTVAIVGIGFLGALLTRLASNAGARVIAISRRQFALDVGRSFGAAETVEMGDHHKIIDRVKELTNGQGCDVVVEAIGMQQSLDLSAELTRERGRLVIAGFHQDGPRNVNMFLWNWRGLDVINAHERDPHVYVRGIRDAVDALRDGRIDPRPLYTHRYPLDQLDLAMSAALERPDGFLKALVTT